MRKKVLFLCSNMGVGGFQKSLISLLRCFDYNKYDVDLLLLNPTGVFMELIPKDVNLLSTTIEPEYFFSGTKAILFMLKRKKYYQAFIRLISCILWIFDKGLGASFMINAVPAISKKYDVCIDYNGQHLLYYMVKKIYACKKISYFHSDYKKWPYYKRADRKYYKNVSAIVTVSDKCVESMKEIFPEYSNKIVCIENINSKKTVNVFPKNSNTYKDKFNGIRIVTVGRICKDKGLDYIYDALIRLLEKNYKVRWYLVGPVTDEKFYKECEDKYGKCDELIFLGPTDNPYDYMRNADIVAQPSKFEGKSVVIEEAKILRKPILVTNFSTAEDQIIDGETGLIVKMNGEAVYEGIKRLIDDKQLIEHIVEMQEKLCKGNETEIEKLYKLIEG